MVLLGLLPPGEIDFLGNVVVTREITMLGAFRFDTEFALHWPMPDVDSPQTFRCAGFKVSTVD